MRASLVALALAACASRVAAQTFSAAQLAAAKPWQFETKEEGQARAHRLRKGHPALRRALFQTWQQDFGKTYKSPAHQADAQAIWQAHLDTVIATNTDPASNWVASMNEYADMTWEEFSKRLGARAPAKRPAAAAAPKPTRKLLQTAPAAVDWVAAGKVTNIRNQGKCAGCWAFAAIAAIESLAKIKNGTTFDMSEQQLLDCAGAALGYSSQGCATGSTGDAFDYIFRRSVGTEAAYPFGSSATGTSGACNATKLAAIKASLRTTTDPGYYMPDYNSRSALMTAMASRPTVTYFNANKNFQLYKSGIFPAANCSDAGVNHAMLVVGYNTTGYNAANATANTAFWRIKNSWGTGWGELGYARVQMLGDGNGACAMYTWAFQPANLA